MRSGDLLFVAKVIATSAHGATGQRRKGPENSFTPYISHPAGVVEIIKAFGYSEAHQAAGWLHDVVEDTKLSLKDIKLILLDIINPDEEAIDLTIGAVRGASHKFDTYGHRQNFTRMVRAHFEIIAVNLYATHPAKIVKLADTLDNLKTPGNLDEDFRMRWLIEKDLFADKLLIEECILLLTVKERLNQLNARYGFRDNPLHDQYFRTFDASVEDYQRLFNQ